MLPVVCLHTVNMRNTEMGGWRESLKQVASGCTVHSQRARPEIYICDSGCGAVHRSHDYRLKEIAPMQDSESDSTYSSAIVSAIKRYMSFIIN